MSRLRDPESGCAWDIKQNFKSIAPYTVEEAYEVADAIERDDMEDLRDELGDLLLQVVFHAQMAKDLQLFEFEDVAKSIVEKMIRRHPHVFGDSVFENEAQQKAHWEQLKQDERASKSSSRASHEKNAESDEGLSAIDGVALALPSLTRAEKIQKRAARVGFDWQSVAPVIDKIDEELGELREALTQSPESVEDELGDLLFATTNVARHLHIDPEQALKKATAKFERRFRHVENRVRDNGLQMQDVSADQLDEHWNAAKRECAD